MGLRMWLKRSKKYKEYSLFNSLLYFKAVYCMLKSLDFLPIGKCGESPLQNNLFYIFLAVS